MINATSPGCITSAFVLEIAHYRPNIDKLHREGGLGVPFQFFIIFFYFSVRCSSGKGEEEGCVQCAGTQSKM